MMPPKCYTWLESCGSQLSDGKNEKLFFCILQSVGFSMTLRTDIFLYTEKLSYAGINHKCHPWLGFHYWIRLLPISLPCDFAQSLVLHLPHGRGIWSNYWDKVSMTICLKHGIFNECTYCACQLYSQKRMGVFIRHQFLLESRAVPNIILSAFLGGSHLWKLAATA